MCSAGSSIADAWRAAHPREDLRARFGLGAEEWLVTNVGSVTERKGQHVFARAVDLLWRRHPDLAARTRCVMLGGGQSAFDQALAATLAELDRPNRVVYLVAFSLAIAATAFLVAPVSAHRLLFRRRAKASLVTFADRCARAGLGCLALSVSSVTFLIFDVLVGTAAAVAAALVAAGLFLANWVVLPLGARRGHPVRRPHR